MNQSIAQIDQATAEARLYRCSYFDATYQPRKVVISGDIIWCACALHDACDRRPDDPAFDAAQPAWHPYDMETLL